MRTEMLNAFKQSLSEGFESFTGFLKVHPDIVNQLFWDEKRSLTFLDYLIDRHRVEADYSSHIAFLLRNGASLGINQPVHRTLRQSKYDLTKLMLLYSLNETVAKESKDLQSDSRKRHGFRKVFKNLGKTVTEKVSDVAGNIVDAYLKPKIDIDAHDLYGNSILKLVIASRDQELLMLALQYGPNVNLEMSLTPAYEKSRSISALHWAVICDNAYALEELFKRMELGEACFWAGDTSILVSASKLNRVNILKILLSQPQILESHCWEQSSIAVDKFLEHLKNDVQRSSAIRGLAMLLCHGVNLNEVQLATMRCHRANLLQETQKYLHDKPALSQAFSEYCHTKDNPLHTLYHSSDSWLQVILCLFGWEDRTAFELEAILGIIQPSTYQDKKFIDFCKCYEKDRQESRFFNPFSQMRRLLTSGEITSWEQVKEYAKDHPHSRTATIVKRMNVIAEPLLETVHNDTMENKI